MERLTKKLYGTDEGYLSCEKCGKLALRSCWSSEDCIQTAVDRLVLIEDILGEDYDLDKLRELVEADKDGRCIVLPKDGMVYYIEEAGGDKWIANKPIQQIIVRCGWGISSLEFSLFDTGKYFNREAAEVALRGE